MDSLWSSHYYHPFFPHFVCLLALWCPQQQNPLQCVVSSSSSSISCILSAGVRNYSPVYLLQKWQWRLTEQNCRVSSNAVVQTIQCPLSWAHSGTLGRHQGLAVRGSGWKSERSGSQALAVTGVLLFCAHHLILFLFNPCPSTSKVLCITVSHYWYSLNSLNYMENILQGLQHSHIFHTVLLLSTKKSSPHLGLTEKLLLQEKTTVFKKK